MTKHSYLIRILNFPLRLCTIIKQKYFFNKIRENGEHIPGVPASPVAGPASDAPHTIQEAIHGSIDIKPGPGLIRLRDRVSDFMGQLELTRKK